MYLHFHFTDKPTDLSDKKLELPVCHTDWLWLLELNVLILFFCMSALGSWSWSHAGTCYLILTRESTLGTLLFSVRGASMIPGVCAATRLLSIFSRLLYQMRHYECMSESTEPIIIGKRYFSDFAQILQVGYDWPKNVSSKGISLAAFRVRHTSMPLYLQNGRKITPYLASKASVTTAHRNGIQTKHHQALQHWLTLALSKNWKTITSALSWKNLETTPRSN